MNTRTFLKLSVAVVASRLVAPMMAWAGADKITNWAGNIGYSTERLQSSASVEDVRAFVKKMRSKWGKEPMDEASLRAIERLRNPRPWKLNDG